MSFYEHVRADVLRHGAINNTYLTRFQAGEVTDREFHEFAVEFYSFARFFPRILAAQLVNTEDEAVADELTKVLYCTGTSSGRLASTFMTRCTHP